MREANFARVAEDTLKYLHKVWEAIRPVMGIEKFAMIWVVMEIFTGNFWRGFVLLVLYLIVFDNNPVDNGDDSSNPAA